MIRYRKKPTKEGQIRRVSFLRRFVIWSILGSLSFLTFSVCLIVLVRFFDPPITPLMLIRRMDYATIEHAWCPLEQISESLQRAVIASEDQSFISHNGFDWKQIESAIEENETRRRHRGASTISMQVSRNLFLWPGGGWVRKVLEAYFTVMLEQGCSKYRIMELYLNIAEWGPGIFGAESAAQFHFKKHAGQLSETEAATLAAILPSPRKWSAGKPGPYVQKRRNTIMSEMDQFKAVRP